MWELYLLGPLTCIYIESVNVDNWRILWFWNRKTSFFCPRLRRRDRHNVVSLKYLWLSVLMESRLLWPHWTMFSGSLFMEAEQVLYEDFRCMWYHRNRVGIGGDRKWLLEIQEEKWEGTTLGKITRWSMESKRTLFRIYYNSAVWLEVTRGRTRCKTIRNNGRILPAPYAIVWFDWKFSVQKLRNVRGNPLGGNFSKVVCMPDLVGCFADTQDNNFIFAKSLKVVGPQVSDVRENIREIRLYVSHADGRYE